MTVKGVDFMLNRSRCSPGTCSGRVTQQGLLNCQGMILSTICREKGLSYRKLNHVNAHWHVVSAREVFFFFFSHNSRRFLKGQALRTGAKGNGLDSACQASLL